MRIEVFIPGKPVPKQSARFGRKRVWQSKRVTDYRTLVASAFHNALVTQTENFTRLQGPVRVEIDAYWSWPKRTRKSLAGTVAHKTTRPDGDNVAKAVLDSCDRLWADDAQVCDLHIRKWYAPEDQVGIKVIIEAI
tara:strand:- start:175 stop:582 length:408 start_codon:yes stop_codon:yes gene_type:complete